MFDSRLFLRRTASLLAVPALLLGLAGCGDDDDDDDDGGTGPSADCIDEVNFAGAFFDEGDVQTISIGGNRSGTLSSTDPELDGWFYDVYAVDVSSNRSITIVVDPAASLDADVMLLTADMTSDPEWYVDVGFEGDAETLEADVTEGCYLIAVSSYEAGATGSYTLSVD